MWGVIGLGNPGGKYSKTRHNIGFMVLEELSGRHKIELKERQLYRAAKGSIGDSEAVLVEPLTFMNRSGIAVREALRRFNIPIENLIVIHDDIDMETGKLKIKAGGSSGGHRGMESIIQSTGTPDFTRVKIGVGRDPEMLPEDYVLMKFSRAELPAVKEAIMTAADAVLSILEEGVRKAMNHYNRRGVIDPGAGVIDPGD